MVFKIYFYLFIIFAFFLPQVYAEIQFEDVSKFAGTFYHGNTRGASWGEFNGDGWPDLFVSHHLGKKQIDNLFVNNRDGTFTDISSDIGFEVLWDNDIHTGSWTDFDNDGDQDLFVTAGAEQGQGTGPNFFFVNQDGSLENKAEEYGLDYVHGRGRMSMWFDWDKDGILDVLIVNSPREDNLAPTALFKQENSSFTKISVFNETKNDIRTAHISDFFLDGNQDIVLLAPFPHGIYNFSKLTPEKIIEINTNTLRIKDIAIGDFNGDLLSDLFIIEGGPKKNQYEMDKLLINSGNGFKDETKISGLNEPTSCLSVVSGDFDNDMDLDLYLVCGIWRISDEFPDKNIPNIFYENLGNGTFTPVENAGGAGGTDLGGGESVSMADYDNDGFLDLFLTNSHMSHGPTQLYQNLGNQNHWIEIDLVGTGSNRDAVGSRVLVNAADTTQVREQNGGGHYRGQNYQRLHFGLAENTIIESIIVFWPSGIANKISNVPSNQIIEIKEPLKPIPPRQQLSLGLKQSQILCKEGLELVTMTNKDNLACLKPSTISSLTNRGLMINPLN